MVNLTINKLDVSVPSGSTILEAARSINIHIPHLCYLKGVNEIGACRLCSVEVEGEAKLIPACDNVVREGMKVVTNSPRVRHAVRTNLELILSQHDCKCAQCVRSGNCRLQSLANDYNILDNPYPVDLPKNKPCCMFSAKPSAESFPFIKEQTKCVKCMRCIQVCDKIQSMHIWDLVSTGSRTRVDVVENRSIEQSNCTRCGQCITHCPVGALRERDDTQKVRAALENPDIVTIAQIAPAVRSAWGESLGLASEYATVNRLAGAMRLMGFDYVFDTSFSADLTIMEEANEFLERKKAGELDEYPMFTSCCPGWVRFVKSQFPQLVGQLSTAKSPQQMFGAVIKSYFAKKINVAPENICCVSVMPCTAKKSECDLPTMVNADGIKDVDYVLTSREVVRMLRASRIHVNDVEESPFDRIMGNYTGAGVIFGATGGVMEAALRTADAVVTGEKHAPDTFKEIRLSSANDNAAWRELAFDLNGKRLHVAVASGLGNARKLCEAVVKKQVHYDFVEIMACPGGCAGGGGQPIHTSDVELAKERGQVLYDIDRKMPLRFSHDNPDIQALYKDFLEKPISEKSEELLHTNHFEWQV